MVKKILKSNQIQGNVKETNKRHLERQQSKAELTKRTTVWAMSVLKLSGGVFWSCEQKKCRITVKSQCHIFRVIDIRMSVSEEEQPVNIKPDKK